jgi:hypothetical protein
VVSDGVVDASREQQPAEGSSKQGRCGHGDGASRVTRQT